MLLQIIRFYKPAGRPKFEERFSWKNYKKLIRHVIGAIKGKYRTGPSVFLCESQSAVQLISMINYIICSQAWGEGSAYGIFTCYMYNYFSSVTPQVARKFKRFQDDSLSLSESFIIVTSSSSSSWKSQGWIGCEEGVVEEDELRSYMYWWGLYNHRVANPVRTLFIKIKYEITLWTGRLSTRRRRRR